MSTSMETNTEQLQEILQTVYALPEVGGSAEPDLIIEYNAPDTTYQINGNIEKFAYNSDDVVNVYNKLLTGQNVNCVLKAEYWPHSGGCVKANSPHITAYAASEDSNSARVGWMTITFNLYKVYTSDEIVVVSLCFNINHDGSATITDVRCCAAYTYSSAFR